MYHFRFHIFIKFKKFQFGDISGDNYYVGKKPWHIGDSFDIGLEPLQLGDLFGDIYCIISTYTGSMVVRLVSKQKK